MAKRIRRLDPALNPNIRRFPCQCPEAIEGEHECRALVKQVRILAQAPFNCHTINTSTNLLIKWA